jgi:hypothetical protein
LDRRCLAGQAANIGDDPADAIMPFSNPIAYALGGMANRRNAAKARLAKKKRCCAA